MELRRCLLLYTLIVVGFSSNTNNNHNNMVAARSRGRPNICMQPPPRSEGVCTIEIEGFYFDQRNNDCMMYVLSGCRTVRGQSFGSRQDCLDTCVHMTRHIEDLRNNE